MDAPAAVNRREAWRAGFLPGGCPARLQGAWMPLQPCHQYRGTAVDGVARAGGSELALVANGFQLFVGGAV
jgi:hypothetical protein